jgi:hypothetical protein
MSEQTNLPAAIRPTPALSWLLRQSASKSQNSAIRRSAESMTMLLVATLAYLVLGEISVRIAIHAPLFELRDFRRERGAKTINRAVEYDSLLGWHLKSFIATPGFNTLEYGFRSNGRGQHQVLAGGVLAVGSSFTAGSEVSDDETWPAHLQQITGWNVNNAGQGNYVADQIIMNGENLLPLIHPQVLVVDLIPDNIVGVGYSAYGWPKPYYTIGDNELVAHNQPVPRTPEPGTDRDRFGLKPLLGHFAVVDQFMVAFFADSWFSSDGSSFTTVKNDAVEVTCRLLARLKQKTDASHTALILYLQFAGSHIMSAPHEADQSVAVGNCARGLHIATIDEYAQLRGVFEKAPDALRKYYQIEPDGSTGHKSSFGNMEVAKSVAAAISGLGVFADGSSLTGHHIEAR